MNRFRCVMACACLVPGIALLSGCIVSGKNRVATTGQPVAEQSLTLLEQGRTTEDQVLQLVGVPTRVVELGDQRKVYVYEWSRRQCSSTRILVLFSGSSSRETRGILNIEVVDGIVSRWWSEQA